MSVALLAMAAVDIRRSSQLSSCADEEEEEEEEEEDDDVDELYDGVVVFQPDPY